MNRSDRRFTETTARHICDSLSSRMQVYVTREALQAARIPTFNHAAMRSLFTAEQARQWAEEHICLVAAQALIAAGTDTQTTSPETAAHV